MAEEPIFSKTDLIAALKEAGIATKDDVRQIIGEEITARGLATKGDVRQIVGAEIAARGLATQDNVRQDILEATDAILAGMDRRFEEQTKYLDQRFSKIETNIAFLKQDITDLKAENSTTPSRREFDTLKQRVDRYIPKN